jgi:hypothetical protein
MRIFTFHIVVVYVVVSREGQGEKAITNVNICYK